MMKLGGAKKQTLFLTGVNAVVRALGLSMRIILSRMLGAEVMGIMELAQSVHMVAIAPLTSGMPVAISRLTARSDDSSKEQALSAGLWISRRISLLLIPLLWLSAPVISRLIGDIRVLPSLFFTAPCILILGYSASFNGYCYGMEHSEIPAFSELIEQTIRFLLTLAGIHFLTHLSAPWMAAVPVSATMAAEIIGLLYVQYALHGIQVLRRPSLSWQKAVIRLASPTTLMRILQTLMRSMTAILIPLRLQHSGLSAAESTAQLGILNGMVNPILMLPGVFTSALSMVMIPRLAKAEEKPSELGRLLKWCFFSSIPVSLFFSLLVFSGSGLLANVVYRQAEAAEMFRMAAFQILLFPIHHMLSSTLSALGQQRRLLYISGITSAVTLLLTWFMAGISINGIIQAQYISHFLSIILELAILILWKKEHSITHDGKYA